jgi:hypothetical protein
VLSEEKRPVPTVAYLPDSENDWIIQIRWGAMYFQSSVATMLSLKIKRRRILSSVGCGFVRVSFGGVGGGYFDITVP